MSLSVKHINGDSTFLISFSPGDGALAPTSPRSPQSQSHAFTSARSNVGGFTILVDPWLSGPSTVYHSKFAHTIHAVPSCIESLTEIDPPSVVLISQDKPDHCHEATLRQLDPLLPHTIILAQAAAARKIKSWKFFDPNKVHALPTYDPRKPTSSLHFYIPSPIYDEEPGEVTISYIPAKCDLTGLHNAIGITYKPPVMVSTKPQMSDFTRPHLVTTMSANSNSGCTLPVQGFLDYSREPITPPRTPVYNTFRLKKRPSKINTSNTGLGLSSHTRTISIPSPELERFNFNQPDTPSASSNRSSAQYDAFFSYASPTSSISSFTTRSSSNLRGSYLGPRAAKSYQHLPQQYAYDSSPQRPRTSGSRHGKQSDEFISPPPLSQQYVMSPPQTPLLSTHHRPPKTLSIIYSPHGCPYSTLLPYVTSHLVSAAALPLTLLLHAFDRVQNPWYLGGNISAGFPGGVEIAEALLAKHWLSAHDEDKIKSGISVKSIVTRKWSVQEVKDYLARKTSGRGGRTQVGCLDVGEELTIMG